jgi:hypothetical protein
MPSPSPRRLFAIDIGLAAVVVLAHGSALVGAALNGSELPTLAFVTLPVALAVAVTGFVGRACEDPQQVDRLLKAHALVLSGAAVGLVAWLIQFATMPLPERFHYSPGIVTGVAVYATYQLTTFWWPKRAFGKRAHWLVAVVLGAAELAVFVRLVGPMLG